jgi:cysteine-rich repeat protein
VGAGETCDDGNRASGDGCSASCQTEPGYTCATAGAACTTTCGDSIVAGTEQCDDGGTATGDGCSATCTIEIGWSCVIDPFRNVSACTMTCGNGTPDPGEQCDDGNTTDQDACSNRCLLGPGVTCVVSPQCALGLCSMGTCAGCYDTAGPGLRDFGCGTTFQVCDTAAMFPACVQCVIDADCAATETCLVGGMICVPRGVDAGTDAGSDAGSDAGTDAGADAGTDAGSDAGVDAGSDAGPRDAGGSDAAMSFDGGVDAGPRVGGASGGACTCSLHARPRGAAWSILTGLVLAGLVARRRRTR